MVTLGILPERSGTIPSVTIWLRLESCQNVWLRLELSLWIEFEKKRVHCIGVIERCEAGIRYPFDNTMLVA